MIGSPNKFGFQIEQYYNSRDYSMNDFILSGSFVIAQKDGKTLLCHNHKREQWELPAGKREPGETPWECAERELKEETHENEETDAIVFWDEEERIGEVDEVDVALLHIEKAL